MSYSPPTDRTRNIAAPDSPPHPSLPPRPPPPTASLPPRPSNASGAPGTASRAAAFSSATTFRPRSLASGNSGWQQSTPTPSYSPSISAGPAPPPGFSMRQPSYVYPPQSQQAYYPQPAPQTYQAAPPPSAYAPESAPKIRNPFPLPGQGGGANSDYDPEMAAQIAQWSSTYASTDNTHDKGFRHRADASHAMIDVSGAAPVDSSTAAVVAGADGKQKTVVRSGGGKTWQDPSLLEWNPAHFRLFIGNLAGEVTDDSLLKAFSRYTSVQKARVVRDKRTTKSKGYGFVSFSDGDDYFQAAKDMQGKYIGSHPVLIKRSTTDIKTSTPAEKKKGFKGKAGFSGDGRANTGAGVSKKQAKTKGGLKILG